ncbi:cytochrome c [Rhodoplanes sp. TEM]|uniref:Cytochrome c n=1 Tax=Rhodoplanes tepidamans TaxID=200616 RepID=A0ABT5JE23_RHOTP|nr:MULTISPECIES: cytochrome c [Rhodoplanes]MDC7787534.1 cytochrome c [Rhodoplanes tepidamans]MDC7983875.1 cytochrome c [Rhodoplanes sp. TEM]MDQ0354312.1 mono/diheme cytochrome c family protein [Rhodoplanes tepidamans]
MRVDAETASDAAAPSPRSHRLLRWSVAALVAVLALDAARSLIAHLAWNEPASLWQPAATQFADIVWPPAAGVAAGASRGARLYGENCAICHGPEGRGNGAAAPSLGPRPRDLVADPFKFKTTPEGEPPTRADLHKVVADGLVASAMPGFRGVLSDADIDAVLDHLGTLGTPVADDDTPRLRVPPRPPVTAATVARGAALYTEQGCGGCHGDALAGGTPMRDAHDHEVTSRDLTAPWTFRGGAAPADVFLRLSTGMAPAPMPAYAHLSETDRWALVAFLESRARPAPGAPGSVLAGPGQSPDPLVRGRYLVRAGMCGLCHTEVSAGGIYRDERYLAGGIRIGAHPQGVFVSRNLTPDRETGLGAWSEADIARAIRDGRTETRLLNVWSMPWVFLHGLSDPDALAIARYLKTLPPVHNAVPAPLHYGTLETALAKLFSGEVWLGRPKTITYASGNYANPKGPDLARLQDGLVALQLLVAAAWLAGLALAIPRRLWVPLGRRSWRGVAGCTAVLAVYATPMLGMLPADMVSREALREVPRPDTADLGPERAALVERGRYLFVNVSCVFCHGPDGRGGLKLSGLPGTLYTANITSDRAAGLGAWSDAEIARAIRSGVGRHGRPLYWQAMPWDHFSNLDEEDVTALVAYLRRLPPVAQPVPAYRPPSPDDCAVYTVWTEPNTAPGCR